MKKIACAISLLLAASACQPIARVQQEDIGTLVIKRRPEAGKIAKAFNNSVRNLDESAPDRGILELDLRILQKTFPSAQYRKGVLTILAFGHRYDIYLLANSPCIKRSPGEPDVLNIAILKPVRDSTTVDETGNYTIFMWEDHYLSWTWDLRPAFRDQEFPHDGGLMIRPNEGDFRKWTKAKLNQPCH
jgi:hypothetical protein